MQHVRPIAVPRPHGPELDPARDRSRQRGVTGLDHDGFLEQAEDAGRGRAAALVEVEHLGDVGERPEQTLGHEDQDGVEADLEVAAQRRPAAEQQRAGEAGEDRHPHERDERGGRADRGRVGVAVGLGDLAHPVALAVLGGERLDRGDAGEVGAERAGQVGDGAADPDVERLEAALEDQRPDDDQRDRQEGQHQQLPGRGGEDAADEQHVEHRLQDRGSADVEEPLELVDVVVERGQRGAGRAGLVPAEVEVLDVVVGLDPQVVFDTLRETAPQHAGDVVGDGLDDPHDDVDDSDPGELLIARLDAQDLTDERRVTSYDDVDGRADQQLGSHVGDLVDRRRHHRPDEAGAVGAIALPQGAQGLVGAGIHGWNLRSRPLFHPLGGDRRLVSGGVGTRRHGNRAP